jgi:glyoxylase-like metal-dependent hydrolase (beta-lactamase superfamily II)
MPAPLRPQPDVRAFFDRPTGSLQYVVHDPATRRGAIIDPVWNYAPEAGALTRDSADAILRYVEQEGLSIDWVIDTHPHADHFSAVALLASELGANTGIGERVVEVQKIWKSLYNLGDEIAADGSQWDRLFLDGDSFQIGNLTVRVMLSPGHTLASVSYVVGDAAFVHDTLMMPANGTSRADFPGGSAKDLWNSIRRILDLPLQTRLFVGHDYPPDDKAPQFVASVAEHRLSNRHVSDAISRDRFLDLRRARDASLALPELMLAAMQVNIRGGRLPAPEGDGHRYLKLPLNRFDPR